MQGSRLPPSAFSLLAYWFPISFERFPHWFPVLGGRFHDHFFNLLLEQPCCQRSQLFGVAAKLLPLKLVLAIDFDVRHNHSQHLFVDINPRYPIGHSSSWPGASGERAALTLSRVAGYRRSRKGTTTPNYSLKHARSGPDSATASTSPVSSRSRRSMPLRS